MYRLTERKVRLLKNQLAEENLFYFITCKILSDGMDEVTPILCSEKYSNTLKILLDELDRSFVDIRSYEEELSIFGAQFFL